MHIAEYVQLIVSEVTINCQLLVFEGPNREYQINCHKMYGDERLKCESNEVSQGLIESEI